MPLRGGNILKMCYETPQGCWFDNALTRQIGEGNEVLLWHDLWVGRATLEVKYHMLYQLSTWCQSYIQDIWHWALDKWNWCLSCRRELQERERKFMDDLLSDLDTIPIRQGVSDNWIWCGNSTEGYFVSSAYFRISGFENSDSDQVFIKLWHVLAPSNAKVFVWRVHWDRIQTKSNLIKRGIVLSGDDAKCPLCLNFEELVEHLFLTCQCSFSLWYSCYNWLGIETVLPNDSRCHFLQHVHGGWSKKQK